MPHDDEHAFQRARERYGLRLERCELRRIVESVHRGDGAFIVMQDETRFLYEIPVGGHRCVVVYDPTEHRIRTFLPPLGDKSIPEYLEMVALFFQWENE